MSPFDTMAASTSRARAAAASGSTRGLKRDGARGNAGDDGGLPERELTSGDTEIDPRGGIHAPGAGAEIDAVQPDLEDLALGEMLAEPEREDQFLHLAAEGARVRQEQILRDLLRDGRSALHDAATRHVGDERAADADRIDAGSAPEAMILDRHGGFRHVGRQIGQVDRLAHDIAIAGEDAAGCVGQGQAGASDGVERRFGTRQVAGEPQEQGGSSKGAPYAGDDEPTEPAPAQARATYGTLGRRCAGGNEAGLGRGPGARHARAGLGKWGAVRKLADLWWHLA